MDRRLLAAAALLVALVALVAAWTSRSSHLERGRADAAHQRASRAPLGPVDLVDSLPSPSAPLVARDAIGDPPPARREALTAPAAVEVAAPTVRGQVVDHFGLPAQGVAVTYRPPGATTGFDRLGPSPGPREEEEEGPALVTLVELGAVDRRDLLGWHTTTDGSGWFEFEGSDARAGGELEYGIGLYAVGLYARSSPTAEVQVDGAPHHLVLPARPASAPRLVVELVDAGDGTRLVPELLALELLGLAPPPTSVSPNSPAPSDPALRHFRTSVHPLDVSVGGRGLVVERLAPGRWELVVRATNSALHRAAVDVPHTGEDVVVRAEVRTFDGLWIEHEEAAQLTTAPDPARGFDAHVPPERRREFGRREADLHFAHTLRGFGPGPFSGAVLELDLEAASYMAHNDSIGLEYLGEAGFAWSSRVASNAPGRRWQQSARATVLIDLGDLVGADGRSLLEHLEDGALDVYVQDDTAVHGLRLHVLP